MIMAATVVIATTKTRIETTNQRSFRLMRLASLCNTSTLDTISTLGCHFAFRCVLRCILSRVYYGGVARTIGAGAATAKSVRVSRRVADLMV